MVKAMTGISVIIPTRNRIDYLRDAVASVSGQSFNDWELLIVNDGRDAVPDFGDSRIKVQKNQQRGAVIARNLGVQEARGKVIAFLDDDDIWIDPDHLAEAWQVLNDGYDFAFADGRMSFPGETPPKKYSQTADALSLESNNTILISAVCYRKELHMRLGAFDESLPYYWDWDWYLRIARAGFRLHHVQKSVVDIRVHAQNMSGQQNLDLRLKNLIQFSSKHKIGPLILKNHTDFAAQ